MSLATYADLQASIASWLHRTDLTAIIPDFVALAEDRFARDLRLDAQLTSGSMLATPTVRAINLPADWLEFTSLNIIAPSGTGVQTSIDFVTSDQLDRHHPENSATGLPLVYSIRNKQLLVGPPPDLAYTVGVVYYARFPALATAGTNWLMTNHRAVYLYACLIEAATWADDTEGLAKWQGLYDTTAGQLAGVDDTATRSGSPLTVRKG